MTIKMCPDCGRMFKGRAYSGHRAGRATSKSKRCPIGGLPAPAPARPSEVELKEYLSTRREMLMRQIDAIDEVLVVVLK